MHQMVLRSAACGYIATSNLNPFPSRQVRSSKSTVDKLKSLLEKNKLVADSQQRLNERPKDMSAVRTLSENWCKVHPHLLTSAVLHVVTERTNGPLQRSP
jgi:hypothetical protein